GSGSITAIFSVFGDTEQLLIRDPNDVAFDEARCEEAAVTGININFDDQLNDDDDIFLDGWTNVALQGTRLWRAQEFSNNLYGQGTAFGDNDNPVMETWLVTPRIDLSEASTLRFESQVGFAVSGHDGLKVFASTDFVGDVTSATWTEINGNVANSNTADNTWIDSGDIDLSSYGESVYIGFQYLGSGPNGETSSYRIDNIIVE
ncbi:MAG: choice-of-anchor J domain-containing protein, partial [Bacteroidota bacterium]